MSISSLLSAVVGQSNYGRMEFYLRPSIRRTNLPLNNQQHRQRMVREMAGALRFACVIETGTFRGASTQFFAGLAPRVESVEATDRFFAYASLRLRGDAGRVRLHKGDSRSFLRALALDPRVPKDNVLFYLDAHWYKDLPLREELEIIFPAWRNAVVLVDDFEVPGTAYTFDDYGPGMRLDASYIEAPVRALGLKRFYPSLPAEQETGYQRGSIVLCREEGVAATLRGLGSLREG